MWDPTTPFATAIGPLGAAHSGIRTLALRTCKADVVLGLPQGKDEELTRGTEEGAEQNENEDGDEKVSRRKKRKWAWGGKWAVVQFCDGKGSEEGKFID